MPRFLSVLTDEERLVSLLPEDGSGIGNQNLRERLGLEEEPYLQLRDQMIEKRIIAKGPGPGGSVKRVVVVEDGTDDEQGESKDGASRRGRPSDEDRLLALIPEDGSTIANRRLAEQLGWDEEKYARVRDRLLEKEMIARATGRGGTVKRILEEPEEEPRNNAGQAGSKQDATGRKTEREKAAKESPRSALGTSTHNDPTPHLPRVFIGSSREGHGIAEWIQAGLEYDAECTIWSQGMFGLSLGNLENLERATKQCDFAVLVLTADDMTTKREVTKMSPRDNVLFELGLFMGSLGRQRTFIVYCSDDRPNLPTDLDGISAATFKKRSDNNVQAALGPVCLKLRHAIGDIVKDKR